MSCSIVHVHIAEKAIYYAMFTLIMMENGEVKKVQGYKSVSLPEGIYQDIEEFLKKSNRYTSVADFVKDSIRKNLKEVEGALA